MDRVKCELGGAATLISTPVQEDGVVEHYERVLHQMSSQLHPYNYLMIDVKQKLALLYGNIAQYSMVTMGRAAKQRKVQLCMDVLDCLGKVVAWSYTVCSKTLVTRLRLVTPPGG